MGNCRCSPGEFLLCRRREINAARPLCQVAGTECTSLSVIKRSCEHGFSIDRIRAMLKMVDQDGVTCGEDSSFGAGLNRRLGKAHAPRQGLAV